MTSSRAGRSRRRRAERVLQRCSPGVTAELRAAARQSSSRRPVRRAEMAFYIRFDGPLDRVTAGVREALGPAGLSVPIVTLADDGGAALDDHGPFANVDEPARRVRDWRAAHRDARTVLGRAVRHAAARPRIRRPARARRVAAAAFSRRSSAKARDSRSSASSSAARSASSSDVSSAACCTASAPTDGTTYLRWPCCSRDDARGVRDSGASGLASRSAACSSRGIARWP